MGPMGEMNEHGSRCKIASLHFTVLLLLAVTSRLP